VWLAAIFLREYFQDRREYNPVGFGRNILLLTILKILPQENRR
jgi:hypothetical protein